MSHAPLSTSTQDRRCPPADATNSAGGLAYALTPRQALAQYAMTGCLQDTFYSRAEAQVREVLGHCSAVDPAFVARTAIHARQAGGMRELPALLCAVLSARDGALLESVFPRVIDSVRMLRTWVQIMRSGAVGRRSLGTRPRRLVRQWLAARHDDAILRASAGARPSLTDVIRMVHPKPATSSRAALQAWLLGRAYDPAALPELAKSFQRFKADPAAELPDLPFELLTAQPLTREHWARIAERVSWQALRAHLNTFARHHVFESPAAVARAGARLRDPGEIRGARALPHQIHVALAHVDPRVPAELRDALRAALDVATANAPFVPGRLVVCPDLSHSMTAPLTGIRSGATSRVTCVEVAALMAASLLRRNPDARLIPFADEARPLPLDPRDTPSTIARMLAVAAGGGTNCAAPLAELNRRRARADVVILISDNESWLGRPAGWQTGVLSEWTRLRERVPSAKLVCIDLQPNGTTQAMSREDVLNVGGFSDAVFGVIERFVRLGGGSDAWVKEIEAVPL